MTYGQRKFPDPSYSKFASGSEGNLERHGAGPERTGCPLRYCQTCHRKKLEHLMDTGSRCVSCADRAQKIHEERVADSRNRQKPITLNGSADWLTRKM